MPTRSDQLLWLTAAIDGIAGFVAGQAWPQPDAGVTPLLAVTLGIFAVGFTALVLHLRRGRP